MKKTLIIASIFSCAMSATILASEAKKTILFRNFEWKTSKDEVVEKDIDQTMEEDKDYGFSENRLIVLEQSVAGYDCVSYYEFNSADELIAGGYILDEKHSNEQQYYLDFVALSGKLKDLYGTPIYDCKELWYDDLWKDDPNKEGMAIITGDLQIGSSWQDEEGNTIDLFIHGDNYECSTVLTYKCSDYDEFDEGPNNSGL